MENAMALGEFAAVMVLSLLLALGVEWPCLRGAFLLLPSPQARARHSAATYSARHRASFVWARVAHKGFARLGKTGLDR